MCENYHHKFSTLLWILHARLHHLSYLINHCLATWLLAMARDQDQLELMGSKSNQWKRNVDFCKVMFSKVTFVQYHGHANMSVNRIAWNLNLVNLIDFKVFSFKQVAVLNKKHHYWHLSSGLLKNFTSLLSHEHSVKAQNKIRCTMKVLPNWLHTKLVCNCALISKFHSHRPDGQFIHFKSSDYVLWFEWS